MPDGARKSGLALPVAVIVLAAAAGTLALMWSRLQSDVPEVSDPMVASTDCDESMRVVHDRREFCPGNRIEVYKYAGLEPPVETGHTTDLVVGEGRTGTVMGPVPSPVDGSPSVARVLWDAQDWPDPEGVLVPRPEFESTVHADHLRLLQ
jgi:hypothetical protein